MKLRVRWLQKAGPAGFQGESQPGVLLAEAIAEAPSSGDGRRLEQRTSQNRS